MSSLSSASILTIIAGMALINFTLRFVPLSLLSKLELPEIALRWLSFVPISVMGALVALEVLRPGDSWQAPATNPGLYAAVLTMLVFRYSKSFLGATVAGMASFVILRSLLGA